MCGDDREFLKAASMGADNREGSASLLYGSQQHGQRYPVAVRAEVDDVSGGDPDGQREPPAKPVPSRQRAAADVVSNCPSGAAEVVEARGAVFGRIEGSGR